MAKADASLLVVESPTSTTDVALTALQAEPFEIVYATGAGEALGQLKARAFDMVVSVLDHAAEIAELIETVTLRVPAPGMPIIVYTEKDRIGLIFPGRPGRISYLKRPASKDELLQVLRKSLPARPAEPSKLDFVKPIVEATIATFREMLGVELERGRAAPRGVDALSGDISGTVVIESPGFHGSVGIAFDETSYLKVLARILGEEMQQVDEHNRAHIGELMNMVFGQTKRALDSRKLGIKTALPSVIHQKSHQIKHEGATPPIVVDFSAPDIGTFRVEIFIAEK